MAMKMRPMPPPLRSRPSPPPKMAANCAIRASTMMAPAIVAAIVPIRMSRFPTCDSSWAMTPSSSSSSIIWSSPCVAATAACCGLRPVANAFGCAWGITYTFGIGIPARCARR